jgi:crotonobetainyl-CoA:carnitine CoA-transferase CaiB-like acyl-CoA transferase
VVSESLPLAGIRVVDLSRFVSGAYAGMLLAALGAEVVKVEVPPQGDPYRSQGTAFVGTESALFQVLNVGKRSVLLDIKSTADREELERLLATADVLLENGRPGSLARSGLDVETLTRRYPELVYASISGFGQSGPDAGKGGFDLILQAEGGLMSVTGEPDGAPVKVGVPALDVGSAISCALGVVSALYRRARTGTGGVVSSSLLEFAVATFTSASPAYFVNGDVPGRMGSHSPTFAPYGAFAAKDGHLVLAGAGSEALWRRLCEALGTPELIDDPRFITNADRVTNLHALTDRIEALLGERTVDEWVDLLEAAGVPAGRVRDLGQVLNSPQAQALNLVREVVGSTGSYRVIGPPLQVDGPLLYPGPAPLLGEHTDTVLASVRKARAARAPETDDAQ